MSSAVHDKNSGGSVHRIALAKSQKNEAALKSIWKIDYGKLRQIISLDELQGRIMA